MTSTAILRYQDHYLHQEQEDQYKQEEVNEELFRHEVGLFPPKEKKMKINLQKKYN